MRVIQYTTHAKNADENERLIRAVFAELRDAAPDGVHYAALRLPDDVFVHIVTAADGAKALRALGAFQAFQSRIDERVVSPPQVGEATLIGNYRMLVE